MTVDRRTLLTVSTAACLCGIYEAYALFVTPFFSPPSDSREGPKPDLSKVPPKNPENLRQAKTYLSDQPWASDSKYQFRTDAGFFYFQEYTRVKQSGKIRFEPFAMIWRPKGSDPRDEPYTIVSDSAQVEFAEEFDIMNPHPGRVVGGALEGTVRIRGPRELAIDGQDFYFAEEAKRVWSDHKVSFQQGPHTGRGLGVDLKLIPASGAPGDDLPSVNGVHSIRLRKDVQMELVAAAQPAGPAGAAEAAPGGQPDSTVFIESEGNFDYDVEAHVATFQKNVRVNRPTGNGQSDRLNCELLTLIFEPQERADKEAADRAAAESLPGDEGGLASVAGDLEFRRLRAEGPVVEVISQRSEMQARMNELTYDAQARVIALRDAKQVRMVQRENELICPEITVVLDESDEIERALCRGAGKLFRYRKQGGPNGPREKRAIDIAASWQKQLQKIPDTETGLDLIEFEGRAVLNRSGKESLQGDVIRIWITPRAQRPAGVARKNRAVPAADDESIQPRRLLALRDVAFASPKITGQTERLEVWFDIGALPLPPLAHASQAKTHNVLRPDPVGGAPRVAVANAPAALTRPPRRNASPGGTPAAGRDRERTVAEGRVVRGQSLAAIADDGLPAAGAPNGETAVGGRAVADPPPSNTARQPDLPLAITADIIRVRTLRERDQDDPQISEVITEGRVHVTQEHREGEAPLELNGERLHLWNYSESNQVLDVSGRPAQVQDRGMQLEGPEIHFDRGQNVASIHGAGVLRRPVAKGLDGKPLDTPQMLDVFWQEKMEFDGEVAKFYDDVRTQLDGNEMRCEEMHVTFNRRISFSDGGGPESQKAEIRFVVCRDGVELKSHEYRENRLVEVRLARGFEFAIDEATGKISAQGPGTLVSWRRGNGKRMGLEPAAASRANRPLAAEPMEWEYTRIDFAGKMLGNMKDRVTTFRDRVRVVYGPVSQLAQTIDDEHPPIDEDNLPRDGGWMRCTVLQLTQHPETTKQPAYIEMAATGNAELEGRSFHALAHSITYDQSKGLYILTGDGKREAQLWRESSPGGQRASHAGKRMEFIPARNEFRMISESAGQSSR